MGISQQLLLTLITLVISTAAVTFRLRESHRVVDEGDRFIAVEVTVANEVELASDVSLVLTPMVAPEDFRPLPTIRPFARANTIPGRIDFFTTPITLNFVAGGTTVLAGDVLIFDDLIDEALEYFVVTLSFQDPANVPPLTSIESNGGDIIRIDIIDNDDIFIGFSLPSTTYPELEADHQIRIIKGAGNITEETISFVVSLFQTAPPGLGTATPSFGREENDFLFPSSTLLSIGTEENDVFVVVTIFADNLPEVTEAAQLRLSLPTDGIFPRFKTLPQYPSFFIIIEDDDSGFLGVNIGFQQTVYTVSEGIVSQEVCVRIFHPPISDRITDTINVAVQTVAGTASESDYGALSGFGTSITLNNANRLRCINIRITDDNVYENDERFSLRLVGFGSLPSNLVLDPSTSTIIIQDNEVVTVGFIGAPYFAREIERRVLFTVGVTTNTVLARNIELSFSTLNSTISGLSCLANANLDFRTARTQFNLNELRTTAQLQVQLIDDNEIEADEMFAGLLTLVNGERVTVDPDIAEFTIVDDESSRCPLGTYVEQLASGVPSCVTCPANSNSVEINSPECTCFNGYYRTNLEGPNIPCTSSSSACRNIELVQQRTRGNSITVRWERPEITGRDDFYYNIFYSEDNQTFTQHNRRPYVKQDALVDYSVSGLRPLTTYTIRVIPENGVSGQEEGGQSRSCEVVAMTGDTRSEAPSRVLGLCSAVVWTTPHRSYRRITGYDVSFVNPGSDNVIVAKGNRELFHVIGDEVSISNQERVMVQVRAKTAAADGRWSTLVTLGCN